MLPGGQNHSPSCFSVSVGIHFHQAWAVSAMVLSEHSQEDDKRKQRGLGISSAGLHLVLDLEIPLFLLPFPVLLGNDFLTLRDALARLRMRAEIAFQALNR
jgi:hypothetical protein